MKILLVDDEAEFVSTLAERLDMRGYDATWCASAHEALKKAGGQSFDLAVLDVKMPGLGGIELRRRLQELTPGMKFIFITGHGSEHDFNVGSEEASCYLGKPVNFDDLIATIKTLADD